MRAVGQSRISKRRIEAVQSLLDGDVRVPASQ